MQEVNILLYDISHGTGGIKRNNRECITTANIIMGLYCMLTDPQGFSSRILENRVDIYMSRHSLFPNYLWE